LTVVSNTTNYPTIPNVSYELRHLYITFSRSASAVFNPVTTSSMVW